MFAAERVGYQHANRSCAISACASRGAWHRSVSKVQVSQRQSMRIGRRDDAERHTPESPWSVDAMRRGLGKAPAIVTSAKGTVPDVSPVKS